MGTCEEFRFSFNIATARVMHITTDGYLQIIEVPLYFQDFLVDLLGRQLIHKHQCNTSKLSYLRSDYIDILSSAGPYLDYVLRQIRKINKLIYKDFIKTTIDCNFVLSFFNGEVRLCLSTGEVLFYRTDDEEFCRLVFSCIIPF